MKITIADLYGYCLEQQVNRDRSRDWFRLMCDISKHGVAFHHYPPCSPVPCDEDGYPMWTQSTMLAELPRIYFLFADGSIC